MKKRHLQTEFIKFLRENKKEQPEAQELPDEILTKQKSKRDIQVQDDLESADLEIQDETQPKDDENQDESDDILTEILREWKKYNFNNSNGRSYR